MMILMSYRSLNGDIGRFGGGDIPTTGTGDCESWAGAGVALLLSIT